MSLLAYLKSETYALPGFVLRPWMSEPPIS